MNVQETGRAIGQKAAEFRARVGTGLESIRESRPVQSTIVFAREKVLPTLKTIAKDADVQKFAATVFARGVHNFVEKHPKVVEPMRRASRNTNVIFGAQVVGTVLERNARKRSRQGKNGLSYFNNVVKPFSQTMARELNNPSKTRATATA